MNHTTLREKEFGAFGHKYQTRLGTAADPDQRSPVFLQFLDCVHQLMEQQPHAFEFSGAFLVELATYAQSEWFSDFMLDCESQRAKVEAHNRAPSIWDYLVTNTQVLHCAASEITYVKLICAQCKPIG